MKEGQMSEIAAERLTETAFAPFGMVYSLGKAEAGSRGETLVRRSKGDGWTDAYTVPPLVATNGSLGLTLGEGGDFTVRKMERHVTTQEALFCAAGPVVLAVAPPSEAEKPSAREIRAFVIEPGMVAVMHEGTWHDACRGIDEPTFYYWMATTGSGSVWMDVEGAPVRVRVRGGRRADA